MDLRYRAIALHDRSFALPSTNGPRHSSICWWCRKRMCARRPTAIRPHLRRAGCLHWLRVASLRESSSISPYWHNEVIHGLAPGYLGPFHTCRRPTQSTVAAFCRHQSPDIAYQQTVDCWEPSFSRHGMTSRKRDISRIIDHILSSPQGTSVQEVFSWLLVGHQLTVSGGSSSSSAT